MKLPRTKAMLVAGVAGVSTLLVGSAVLVSGADSRPAPAERTGPVAGATAPADQVQYDDTYAIVTDPPSTGSDQTARPAETAPAPAAPAPAPTVTPSGPRSDEPTTMPEPEPEPKPTTTTTPPTTQPPTTTVPGLYPKDLPPGFEIPEEWPANKPLPPIPAGCVRGELEDNGVWNCEH